ncbi:MAG: hypothetical protein AB7V46_11760 [Thermomicrobiales bacterium]
MADWHELDDEMPTFNTEAEREVWARILMAQDDWCQAIMARDDHGNMVVRFRYDDGQEEVYDVQVRRLLRVAPSDEGN